MSRGEPLLEVTDLVKHFPIKAGAIIEREVARVRAVDGVSLTLREGETLGLVGESGCGKSTLCRLILQLTAPTSGSVRFRGQELVGRSRRDLRPIRRDIQMVFQDPYASLNPRKRIGQIIGDPIELHGLASGGEVKRQVQDLLDRVGLAPEHYNRFPHEFSGGQRQRIGIARALALRPKLIIADEPVSALDVSVQASVLDLLAELQRLGGIVDSLADLLVGELAGQAQRKGDVLEHRQMWVQGVVLEHHREVAVARRLVVDPLVADEHVAGGDVLEADDHPQQRRLPTSGRTDQDHELAVGDVQAYVVDGRITVAVLLDDVAHGDCCHGVIPSLLRRSDRRRCAAER